MKKVNKHYGYNMKLMKMNREKYKNSLLQKKKRGYRLIIHNIYFTTGFKNTDIAN